MKNGISILLINPWITDFAAYNLWAEPLGLYYIASILREAGARVNYINCLVSSHNKNPRPKENGCSKYIRRVIEKPDCLLSIPRHFAIYGMGDEEFILKLRSAELPDAVLITSLMTYWYPGAFRVIKLVRSVLGGGIPIILGGIYTKLCKAHAYRRAKADFIYTEDDPFSLLVLIERISGKEFGKYPCLHSFAEYPLPMHELHKGMNFFALLTRRGCPYRCSYCASPILCSEFTGRIKSNVISEIVKYTKYLATKNIAFYDDALLVGPEHHIVPILEEISESFRGLSFYLPNGVHASLITPRIAQLFSLAGIKTVRIGLETANENLQDKMGKKTTNIEYVKAVHYLREAGYQRKDLGTYIMAGLPGQTADDVDASIDFVYRAGGSPYLSYFSPIPGTKIWKEATRTSPFPIEREPLFQNNTVYILGNTLFSEGSLRYLKDKTVELRKAL